MLRKKLLPTANAVVSGGTATFDLPVGLKYHTIWLKTGYDGSNTNKRTAVATTAANTAANQILGDIRVKLNGKTQRTHSASQLNAMNAGNGSAFALKTSGTEGSSGYREYIPIFFAEPWRKDVREQELPAWNLNGVRSFQIEVDVKTITSPVLSGFYEYEPANGDIGTITKVLRQSFAVAGTSLDLNTIDRRDYLQQISIFNTSYPDNTAGQYINKVKLTAHGTEIQDLLDYLDNRALLLGRELNPDTAAKPRFDLVLDSDDRLGGAMNLNGLNELTLHLEFDSTASGTMDALIVRAGPPE